MRSRAEAPERLSSTLTSRLASRRTSATSRIDRPEAVLRVRFMLDSLLPGPFRPYGLLSKAGCGRLYAGRGCAPAKLGKPWQKRS